MTGPALLIDRVVGVENPDKRMVNAFPLSLGRNFG